MHKKSLAFFLFAFIPAFVLGQGNKIKDELVPEAVVKSYHDKYKKRPVKTWYENEYGYSAIFIKGDLKPQAFFKNDGTWVKTTLKVKESSVSGAVKKSIQNTQWSDWKVTDRYRVETPDYPKLFEIHFKKGKETAVILFDPTGKALEVQ